MTDTYLTNLPKVTEDELRYQRAQIELGGYLLKFRQEHSLTPSEMFALLAAETAGLAQACIKTERDK